MDRISNKKKRSIVKNFMVHIELTIFLKTLFMGDTHREAETQAEGEAGSLQGLSLIHISEPTRLEC